MSSETASFLKELKKQAHLQSTLHTHRFFPRQLDPFTSFIGNYPWQVLLISSGITAFVWAVLQQWDIPFL